VSNKCITVYGVVSDRAGAEGALNSLRIKGFRNIDLALLSPDSPVRKGFTHVKSTKAPEGAATGGIVGAMAGGMLGWLAGVGGIEMAELAPFIAAGPIMGLMAGAGAASALGGFLGCLIGFGVPEYEAKRIEGALPEKNMVVSVRCDDLFWCNRATETLEMAGATSIATTRLTPATNRETTVATLAAETR